MELTGSNEIQSNFLGLNFKKIFGKKDTNSNLTDDIDKINAMIKNGTAILATEGTAGHGKGTSDSKSGKSGIDMSSLGNQIKSVIQESEGVKQRINQAIKDGLIIIK